MSVFINKRRWSDKPPVGVQPIWSHPMMGGVRLFVPFQGLGGAVRNIGSPGGGNSISNLLAGMSWVRTQGGLGLHCTTAANGVIAIGNDSKIPIPLNSCTVILRRRKTSGSAVASSIFGISGGSGTNIINCHLPFSDGTGYWDFGGNSGSNRLTSAAIPVTGVQNWVFTAGGKGMFMYLNGKLLASTSTAVTRTSANLTFSINGGAAGTGDDQDFYLFGVFNAEWNSAMVSWWNQEPYAMFMGSGPRLFAAAGAVPGTVISPNTKISGGTVIH